MKAAISKRSPEFIRKIYRLFRYRNESSQQWRELGFRRRQQALIRKTFSPATEKLIVFLVPGADPFTGKDTVSGGVISIVSICEETREMKNIHGAETILCTINGDALLLKHDNFENNTPVFRFAQLPAYFKSVKSLLVHVPEFMVAMFFERLTTADRQWLSGIDQVQLNIMNQNIRLMPGPEVIDAARKEVNTVTITTAHQKYCTQDYRNHFGVPIHKLSVWISPEQYDRKAWARKENLLVVSPDQHPQKEQILAALSAIPGLTVQIIRNLTYSQYKELIARAKWSLTFGEGLDGYLIEPVFSGAISFAVYNEQFFTPDFGALQTVYADIDLLKQSIAQDMQRFNGTPEGEAYQQAQFELCAYYYSKEQYRKNIRAFYQQAYTYA